MKQTVLSIILLSCFYYGSSANAIQQFKAKSCEGENFPKPPCCGIGKINSARIINGTKADKNEFPWMVYLGHCGGSLINSQWVLTAAHCIEENYKHTAYFGGQNCKDGSCKKYAKKIGIKKEISLDYFEDFHYDDIALFQLEEPVTFSEAIKPICLPTAVNQDLGGIKATVSGWGKTDGYGDYSPDLLKTTMEIWDSERCEKFAGFETNLNVTSQICAGGESNDTCHGDSGGPLMLKSNDKQNKEFYYQVGIVSFGIRFCLNNGFPKIFTKVDNYMNWIKSTILEN